MKKNVDLVEGISKYKILFMVMIAFLFVWCEYLSKINLDKVYFSNF